MNFLYGVLVIAIVILALRTVMKTAAALSRWFGLLFWLGRRQHKTRDRFLHPSVEVQPLPPGSAAPDWSALSRELRQSILVRGVRASSQTRRRDQLDEAIEIEKREIELARLRAEKSQLKAWHKSVRSAARSARQGHGADLPIVPIAQLKAMREATRAGQSKQPTATPLSPLHH